MRACVRVYQYIIQKKENRHYIVCKTKSRQISTYIRPQFHDISIREAIFSEMNYYT